MECTFEIFGDAVVAQVRGRVDESTWQDFSAALSGAVKRASDNHLERLIIDFATLEYMSSRGLRVLTVAKREADEAGVAVELASPNDVMREILSISRYDKLFKVTDAVETKA